MKNNNDAVTYSIRCGNTQLLQRLIEIDKEYDNKIKEFFKEGDEVSEIVNGLIGCIEKPELTLLELQKYGMELLPTSYLLSKSYYKIRNCLGTKCWNEEVRVNYSKFKCDTLIINTFFKSWNGVKYFPNSAIFIKYNIVLHL